MSSQKPESTKSDTNQLTVFLPQFAALVETRTMSISSAEESSLKDKSNRSFGTEATHQGEMSPSPVPRRDLRGGEDSRRQRRLLRMQRAVRNTASHQGTPSQLFMPNLDAETEAMEQHKASLWDSQFMLAVYVSVAASCLCKTLYFLYGIPLFLLFQMGLLVFKWSHFIGDDPQMKKAIEGWGRHQQQAMQELHRSNEGGFIRRRQEVIMAGISYNSMFHWQNYFVRQAHAIDQRNRNIFKERIAQYKANK
jgi:hypothetical protein